MIKRKELVDYANSKKDQALQYTIKNKNYIFIEAINALCQCGFAIRDDKKANIKAFKVSEDAFDAKYQFGYVSFIEDTVEANLALSYIYILSMMKMNEQNVSFEHIKPLPFFKFHKSISLNLLISKLQYGLNYNNTLFQVECFASTWDIDLHYFVDIALNSMEYKNKNIFK